MFQMTFAIITPALVVGAFAERLRFSAVLLFAGAWLVVVYAPLCHWVCVGRRHGFSDTLMSRTAAP